MRRIKVLRVISRLNIGGPAVHTVLLTEGLHKEKFESILVTGCISNGEADMMYLADEKNIKPIIIPEIGRDINLKKDLISLFKLYCLIRKEKPDIVHTHAAKAGTLGRVAAILAGVPIKIHTFHGHVLHSYFGRVKTKIFVWIERILSHFTDRTIAVCGGIKEELLTFGIGNSSKIVVINLGLELDKLLSISICSMPAVKIGIVGRLAPIKNHRMFLDAIKQILSIPDFDNGLKFIIVGNGEMENELKDYARQLKIEDVVVFSGWKKEPEKIYRDLDIVVLTSLNEGTPVSLIEAMAAGKAIVATDVGGVRDLLGNGRQDVVDGDASFNITERGILVKSKDVNGFGSALRFLLQNTDIRLRIGKQGREFVRRNFNKDRLVQDIEKLYAELVKEKS